MDKIEDLNMKERQELILAGIRYNGVFVHPHKKKRTSRQLPHIIYVQEGKEASILELAEIFGYEYVYVSSSVRSYVGEKVKYNKYERSDKSSISGLRKSWI